MDRETITHLPGSQDATTLCISLPAVSKVVHGVKSSQNFKRSECLCLIVLQDESPLKKYDSGSGAGTIRL
jgi:hypothetical protein